MFHRIRPGLLFTILCLILFQSQVVHAELEGMWRAEHPELGGVFFRIKSDKSCSYFLEKGTETTIYKGTWSEIPTGLELTFENGVTMSVGELKPQILDVRMEFAPGHDVAAGVVVGQALLIESKAIGRMTVDPDKEEEEEDRTGYFGAWEGELLTGEKIYFLINEDRTAGLNYSFSNPDKAGVDAQLIGYWKKDAERLHIYWNDGGFTNLETNGRRIEQTSFKAGELLEDAKGYTCRVIPIREKELPEEWLKTFKKNYVERMPIVVMRQLSQIKSFFRGDWVIGETKDGEKPNVVELKRFSNAWTNRFGGVKGDWYPNSDSVTIVWRNGVKETVSPVGNQFTIMSFNPDQPLSGRPARIDVANPIDQDKIGYYVNRKSELLDPARFFKQLRSSVKNKDKDKKDDEKDKE